MDFRKYLSEAELAAAQPSVGDELDISINDLINIETEVLESTEDGITIALDERALEILEACGCELEDDVEEAEQVDEAHLTRQYDLQLVKDMGDGYYIAVEDHSDDDVRKMSHVVYYLEDPRGLEDKFAPVWRFVGYLNTSAYNPKSEDIINAAKAVIAKDTGAGQSESVVEDVVAHKTHGAVYGKDGKAKLFMTRSEAEAVADKMAAEHKDKTGISVIQGPFTGYLVKMPESMIEGISKGAIKIKTKIEGMSDDERKAYFKGMSKAAIERKLRLNGFGDRARNYLKYHDGVTESVNEARYEIHHIDADGKTKAIQHYGDDYSDETVRKDAKYLQRQNPSSTIKVLKDKKPFDLGDVNEAEYQGRSVQLGKPTRGDVKKYKVYVRDPKSGNIKKVNFGDKNMEIKRDNPERRKNFRARHNCSDKKDRTKAGYWSCRMWSSKPVSKIV